MKIPLQKAFQILQDASAVIINDQIVVYPCLADLDGDDTNEFLSITWDEGGLEYSLKFNEGDNQEVGVFGSSMFLYDTDTMDEDDHTQITILVPQNLEVEPLEERL
jgi:hypothetical protein